MSEDIELENSQNLPSEEDVNTEPIEDTDAESETEDGQPEYTEAERKMFARAKKAEAEARELRARLKAQPSPKEPSKPPSGDSSLSQMDLYALMQASVPQEDVEDVVEYAKLKRISVSEALKANVVKTILNEKAEERRTASATSTGGGRKGGAAKVSDEALLKQVRAGKLPESDDDMKRIVELRLEEKRQKTQK